MAARVAAGAVQGYFGGWTDLLFQRVIEIWTSVPSLYLLLIISSVLVPGFFVLLGILLLFYNGRGILGWLLVLAGLTIIGAGILLNLTIFFQPTSLFATLIMIVLLVGGLGLVARSLRAH